MQQPHTIQVWGIVRLFQLGSFHNLLADERKITPHFLFYKLTFRSLMSIKMNSIMGNFNLKNDFTVMVEQSQAEVYKHLLSYVKNKGWTIGL